MHRKLIVVTLLLCFLTALANASTVTKRKDQQSESGKIKSLKAELSKVKQEISVYLLRLQYSSKSQVRPDAKKLRLLTLLRRIEIKASKMKSAPARKLLKDLQEVRKKVRKIDQTVRNNKIHDELVAHTKGIRIRPVAKFQERASGQGSISGIITDASNSEPIAFAEVSIFDSSGDYYSYGYTDSTGAYSVPVDNGTFFAATYNYNGFTDELYDDIPCEPSCNVILGTPITVNGATSGINFALIPPGRISGKVTDTNTGDPIAEIGIDIYDEEGNYRAYGQTDALGNYTTEGGLDTGNYFAIAGAYSDTHIGELYQDQPCPSGCNPVLGTPIAVTSGSTTPGINFELIIGGSISGTITNASSGPISSEVYIFDAAGNGIRQGETDASGRYKVGGLPTGHYFVQTSNDEYYINELYDNIPCPSWCNPKLGIPIYVTLGLERTGIDFVLTASGAIRGTVLDEQTLNSIPFTGIQIYDAARDYVAYGYTDETGAYSARGLLSGNYYARTSTYGDFYFDELYDNIPCNDGCNLRNGTKIGVVVGEASATADFRLQKGGSIEGTLTDSVTDDPIPYVGVDVYDASGDFVSYGYSDATGTYVVGGLSTGNYYVRTSSYNNYINELYDDRLCPDSTCDPTDGDPVEVTTGIATIGIDFVLDPGGSISGTVISSSTSTPLENFAIGVFDSTGNLVFYGFSDGAGTYTVEGLQTGNYYLVAFSFENYLDELYNSVPCPYGSCNPLSGEPVPVTLSQNTPGINFALDKGGSIAGRVIDSTTSAGIEYSGVYIYDSSGNFLSYAYTDEVGNYHSEYPGLLSGTFFAQTTTYGYVDELYDDLPCDEGCNVLNGTEIPVTVGNISENINFGLNRGGSISGTVTDSETALPVPDVYIEVYDSSNEYVSYGYTNLSGNYTTYGELSTGDYYVVAYAYGAYNSEVYNDIPCPDGNCDPGSGTPVPVISSEETAGINFELDPSEDEVCTPPTFSPSSLPDGNLGVYYSQTITLSGGDPPYHIYPYNGSLPPGFSFDEDTGVISGVSVLAGVFTFTLSARDSNDCYRYWTYTITITTGTCQLCDDFEDGTIATDWSYKGSWQETNGNLAATSNGNAAQAIGDPVFAGCTNCTLITEFQRAGDGIVSIFAWYQNRGERVELLIKENRIVLKQHSGGRLVAKKKAKVNVQPGVSYRVALAFDGTNIIATFQGFTAIKMPVSASIFGTFGFSLKNTTAEFHSISVY